MQNIPVLSTIAFGFTIIFSCAVYTLAQAPARPAHAVEPVKTAAPRHTSINFSYVDGPQAEPPEWPAAYTP